MNRWNTKSDLKTAFDALKAVVPFKHTPRVTDLVVSVEKALGRPLPADLCSFYETFSQHSLEHFLAAADVIRIFPVEEVHIWRDDGLVDRESLGPSWAKAEFLVFGGTVFGDELLYNISDNTPVSHGAVLVTDHEGDFPIKILSDCFADWLSRIVAYSGIELAVVQGSADDIASVDALAFAEDHLRLNPDSEWAARKVYAAQTPHPHPLIYWDKRERRLRPIEEITWLENVTLSNVESTNLNSLVSLKEVQDLTLSSCNVADLSPLAHLQKLEWLGIYDGPDTSVAPLAALPKLNQLRTLRTHLHDVAALKAIPTLDFLEITNSVFDDVAAVAHISSLTKLSLSGTQINTLTPLVALQRLTYLQVDGTRITDLAPVVELRNLKSLIISKGTFHKKVIANIRRRLPELELSEW